MNNTELLKGILEGCILEILKKKENYGYGITKELKEMGFTNIVEGTVYTILIRLEKKELVISKLKKSKAGPYKKIYMINENGKEKLIEFWNDFNEINKILKKIKEK